MATDKSEDVVEQVEFGRKAMDLQSHWRSDRADPTRTPLGEAYALLELGAISQLIRDEMLDFCRHWRKHFPLRDELGRLVVPFHADEPRLLDRARKFVRGALEAGEFEATGVDAREPLKGRMHIPRDAWPAFVVNFERSEVSTGAAVIRDVRVGRAEARVPFASSTAALSPPPAVDDRDVRVAPFKFSESEARHWYKRRVEDWPGDSPPPSERGDVRAAKERFAGKIPRDTIRKIRRDIAPVEWRTRGPRGPREKFAK